MRVSRAQDSDEGISRPDVTNGPGVHNEPLCSRRRAMIHEFTSGDKPYLCWLDMHPTGYVVNTYRRQPYSPQYMVLHRATCKKIKELTAGGANEGGFTERRYAKICADTIP